MSSLMLSTVRLKKHDTVLHKPAPKTEEHSVPPTHSAEFTLILHPDRETCVGEEGTREGKEMGLGKAKHRGSMSLTEAKVLGLKLSLWGFSST